MKLFGFHAIIFLAQLFVCAGEGMLRHGHGGDASIVANTAYLENYRDVRSDMSHVYHAVAPIIKNIAANGIAQEAPDHGEISLRRSLAKGDFKDLNEIFEGAVIKIPNQSISVSAGFTLTLNLSNLRCTGFSIGDIVLKYTRTNDQKLSFSMEILQVDLKCSLTYRYSYLFFSGEGRTDAYLNDNSARLSFGFESSDFNLKPPTKVTMKKCEQDKDMIKIRVSELDFYGGIVSSILELFDSAISGAIEDSVKDVACSTLGESGSSLGTDLINSVNGMIEPYLVELPSDYTDPLHLEKWFVFPEAFNPLNFQDLDNELGELITTVLDEAYNFLGVKKRSDSENLKINDVIRDNFLKDRVLSINITDLDFAPDGVIFEGHDQLTKSKITLDGVNLIGLDTITEFKPLIEIGKYSLENIVKFSYLKAEVNITIDVQASTKPDSLFEKPGAGRVIEKVSIEFGADDVATSVSTFLVVDQEKFQSITLGSLFDTKNLMGCLLSTIFEAQLSGFNVTVGNLREPLSSGFIGKGIDRVLSQAADFLFIVYEGVLIKALPSVFQTMVRDMVNKEIFSSFLGDPDKAVCRIRTNLPSSSPSSPPSIVPSFFPSNSPSGLPSSTATFSKSPSANPSKASSIAPTIAPSLMQNSSPSVEVSSIPTGLPTESSSPSNKSSSSSPTVLPDLVSASTTSSPTTQPQPPSKPSLLRKGSNFFD